MEQKRLHLLILDDSPNQAEALVSLFRNAGHAARVHRLTSSEDLVEALKQEWDLLVAAPVSTNLVAKDVFSVIRLQNLDIPCIQLIESPVKMEDALAALNQGAKSAVPVDAPDILLLVARRELDGLYNRRQIAQLDQALRESQKRCQLLLDSSMDAVAYIHEGMHIYTNHAYLELFGYKDNDDLEGMPIIDLFTSDNMAQLKDIFKKRVDAEATCKGIRADGSSFPAHIDISPAVYDGEECIQLVVRVNASSAELEEKIREIANQDPVTGLYNRGYMMEFLEQQIIQIHKGELYASLVYIKIDSYAGMLREMGIAGADVLLADLAKILQKQMSKNIQLARFHDDVFIAFCPEKHADEMQQEFKKLVDYVRNHVFEAANRTAQITLSIGIADFDRKTADPQVIIDRAQRASDKLSDGNGIMVYDPSEELAVAASRGDIAALLQQTLLNNGLSLVYQPIVNLRGDSKEYYEVRLRMLDKNGNVLPLVDLLSVAQETGLAEKIDRWILVNAVKALALQKANGHDTSLFVQISKTTLRDDTLVPWLEALLNKAKLPHDELIIQFSESDASSHLIQAQQMANSLKRIGCRIAVSDFGTSPNSMALMNYLPMDFVKVDPQFISKSNRKENEDQLKELLSALRQKSKLTIVPFVENASVLTTLWQAGADYVQGYYLQKPAPTMDYDFSA